MGVINKSIGTIKKGLRATFVKAFANGEDPADVMDFITKTTSDGADEDYGWLGTSPQMEQWVDERNLKGVLDFEYTIPNLDYEATLQVSRNDFEDDRLGAVKIRIDDLARVARNHPRKRFFEVLVEGTTELCYDGQPMFSASHEEGESGTQSNLIAGTGTTLALLRDDIENVEALMMLLKNDQGEPFDESDIKIGIICPPALKSKFRELNSSKVIANGDNPLQGMIARLTTSGRLTDANDWYMGNIAEGVRGIIQQERKAPTFESQEADSDAGFMRKMYAFGIDYRVGFGYGLWQRLFKVTNA